MSLHFYSDQQTIDNSPSPTIQNLLNENKMKDMALNKASNLIQLLSAEVDFNISQLEAERNTAQEVIQQLEQQIRYKYEQEKEKMMQKIEFLERELKRSNIPVNLGDKSSRQSIFNRSDSSKSLSNQKKRSVNKTYTQNNNPTDKQNDLKNKLLQYNLYKQHYINYEEWKLMIIDEIDNMVTLQYEQLGDLAENITNAVRECDELFEEEEPMEDKQYEMTELIKEQQALINALIQHNQELNDMIKNVEFQLNSIVSHKEDNHRKSIIVDIGIEDALIELKVKTQQKKEAWEKRMQELQRQNEQLRNILQNMIRLVREQKRLSS